MARSPKVWCITVKHSKREELFVHSFPLQSPPPPTHTHRTSTTHTGERQIWDWQQWFQCLFFLCLFSFNLLHSTDPHILDCAVHSLGFMLLESNVCVCVCVGGGGACMHALRMVSKNKILCFINTLLFIIKKQRNCCTTERQDGYLAHA